MSSFLESVSPEPMRRRLATLYETDPVVTVTGYMLGQEKLLEWAHAVPKDAELRAAISPIPPVKLRSLTAAPEEEVFLWTGLIDLANFFSIYDRLGQRPSGRPLSVLDFGCGCGRMTRYLNMMENTQAYGVDINPDLVAWCQKNLAKVRTTRNRQQPPMDCAPASIDIAYSLSIFTHLPEDRIQEWLTDVARVLRPGGVFIVTTHGIPALNIIRGSKVHQEMFKLDETGAAKLIERLPTEHFIHMAYGWSLIDFAKTGSRYGNSFIDETYVRTHWNNACFDVIEFIPGGLRGWQDIVVLKRK